MKKIKIFALTAYLIFSFSIMANAKEQKDQNKFFVVKESLNTNSKKNSDIFKIEKENRHENSVSEQSFMNFDDTKNINYENSNNFPTPKKNNRRKRKNYCSKPSKYKEIMTNLLMLEDSTNNKTNYGILKKNSNKNFKSSIMQMKKINNQNYSNLKKTIKRLNVIFSDFISTYECNNQEELINFLKDKKFKNFEMVLDLTGSKEKEFLQSFELFKKCLKSFEDELNEKSFENFEENEKISNMLLELKQKFKKFVLQFAEILKIFNNYKLTNLISFLVDIKSSW